MDLIGAALRAYHETHHTFPDRKSKEGLPAGTWGAAQKWLRGRGLTFRDLLGMAPWHEHTRKRYEWSVDAIHAAAQEVGRRKPGHPERVGGK